MPLNQVIHVKGDYSILVLYKVSISENIHFMLQYKEEPLNIYMTSLINHCEKLETVLMDETNLLYVVHSLTYYIYTMKQCNAPWERAELDFDNFQVDGIITGLDDVCLHALDTKIFLCSENVVGTRCFSINKCKHFLVNSVTNVSILLGSDWPLISISILYSSKRFMCDPYDLTGKDSYQHISMTSRNCHA